MILVIAFIVGFAAGIGTALLLLLQKNQGLKTQLAVVEAERAHDSRVYRDTMAEKERLFNETLQRQQQHSRESLDALQARFDETVGKLKAEMASITSDMLRRRQEEFAGVASENMTRILEPLNLNLKQMREAVAENTSSHVRLGGALANNLQLVMQHSDAARQSAERLAEALRGGGKVQGDWGEVVLTELLEAHGLKEGIHFDTQVTLSQDRGVAATSGENMSRKRPDVVLNLDRDRVVIIDAKVSLTSFIDYVNAESEEMRTIALKKHIESLEKHVKELASKNYSSYVSPPKKSVNYVIMFVPTMAALYVATNAKSDLWRKAMDQGVYIADEQTLHAALKIIDLTWRQIAQAENHEKVYRLADEMLDRVAKFMEKFSEIGTRLKGVEKVYDEAFAKLKESGPGIPSTCRKLVEMGARPKKMPKGVSPSLLGLADTPDELD